MHVNDVGADRDVHRHRHAEAVAGGEDAELSVLELRPGEHAPEAVAEPRAGRCRLADREVQEPSRLLRHAEAAVAEPRPDVLRRAAGVRELQGRLVDGDEVVVLFLCRPFAEQRDVVVVRPDIPE